MVQTLTMNSADLSSIQTQTFNYILGSPPLTFALPAYDYSGTFDPAIHQQGYTFSLSGLSVSEALMPAEFTISDDSTLTSPVSLSRAVSFSTLDVNQVVSHVYSGTASIDDSSTGLSLTGTQLFYFTINVLECIPQLVANPAILTGIFDIGAGVPLVINVPLI